MVFDRNGTFRVIGFICLLCLLLDTRSGVAKIFSGPSVNKNLQRKMIALRISTAVYSVSQYVFPLTLRVVSGQLSVLVRNWHYGKWS